MVPVTRAVAGCSTCPVQAEAGIRQFGPTLPVPMDANVRLRDAHAVTEAKSSTSHRHASAREHEQPRIRRGASATAIRRQG